MTLLLNPKTENQLEAVKRHFPHALLLSGQSGVGLTTIARYLAGSDLAGFIEPHDNKEEIDHETGTISVAAIRNLYDQTRSKSTLRQVFILDSVDRLSSGAQAAFLKLLEEPTSSTHFILTSHEPQALLPTVLSRVQKVTIEPLLEEQTKKFLTERGVNDPQVIKQLEYLASGLPAELLRLTMDEAYFKERAEVMTDTRTFLAGSTYDKLLIVHKYHQNRAKALALIDSALTVTKRSFSIKPQPNLVTNLDALLIVKENISANCNIRLQLTAFVVQ